MGVRCDDLTRWVVQLREGGNFYLEGRTAFLRGVCCASASGEKLRGKSRYLFQPCPIEAWAGVLLSAGGDVFMPCQIGDGVVLPQSPAKIHQALVLGLFKGVALQAFEFNADRIVIALGASTVVGLPRMPGAVVTAHELPKRAVPADVKVRRDLQPPDGLEIRVGIPVELVGEQTLHGIATVLTGRKADRVDHDQVDAGLRGSRPEIGRCQSLRLRVPALLPQGG